MASIRSRAACVGVLCAALSGCGSSRDTHVAQRNFSWKSVAAALESRGWKAKQVVGMPHTLSGYAQRFFLQTVAPDGARIDMQFFARPAQAMVERVDVQRAMHVSNVTSIGDAFVRARGSAPLPAADLNALRRLLPR